MPAVWTFYLGLTDQLGADPQNVLERTLGLWALRFLILTLAITPLRRLGGPNLDPLSPHAGPARLLLRAMHLSVYLVLDKDLDLAAIWADIVKRPYITVGMLAFTILVPLAVTSNNASIRRLGGAAWARLHKLVYVAIAAAALHFIMLAEGVGGRAADLCGDRGGAAGVSAGGISDEAAARRPVPSPHSSVGRGLG